jgi:uncharacterized membrane protein
MGVLDRFLLLLLMSPFVLVAFGVAMNALEEARHQSNTAKRVALKLAALGIASLALGFTFLIVTDDDAHWCTETNRDDPGCMHHGGE